MSYLTRACLILAIVVMPKQVIAQSADGALRAHGGPVRALAQLADGRLASASFDSTIIVWDLSRGRAERVLRQHDTAVNALVSRPDGCLISGGEDGRIKIWCEKPAAELAALSGHQAAVAALALAPDGRTLASGSWDRTVRVWDAEGASRVIAEHAAPVTGVVFVNEGAAVLSSSHDGTVRLTPVHGTGAPRVLKLEGAVNALVRTPQGGALIVGADGVLREIDAQLAAVRVIASLDGPLTAVALSTDGKSAAVGGLRTPLTLIDIASGAVKPTPPGPGLPLWAVIFSPDGRELFTGSGDRAVRRFDAATGRANTPSIATVPNPELADTKDRGAVVFRACSACHGVTRNDTHLAGPTLHQIMGRRIASLGGYEFSKALTGMDIVWTPETISKLFEVGPAQYTPGTKMPEQRITDPDERQALVAWLTRVTTP
jgi:cytochrome c